MFKPTAVGDPPTKRQKFVLDCIAKFQADQGFAPTVRELGKLIGTDNPTGVNCHLVALERKGLLTWNPRQARTIRVLEAGKTALPSEPMHGASPPVKRRSRKRA